MIRSSRLYQFFVTDDTARWQAFAISLIFSVVAGLAFLVAGLPERMAAGIACVVSVGVFLFLASRYVGSSGRVRSHGIGRTRRDAFAVAKLAIVASANWAVEALLGNVASAFIFAGACTKAVRADQSVSATRAAFYKAVVAAHLQSSPVPEQKRLRTAYAQLAFAEEYASVVAATGRPANVSTEQQMTAELNNPVWFRGESKTAGLDFHPHSGEAAAFAVGRDLILDTMTFRCSPTRLVERAPALLKLIGYPRVIVKNCNVIGFSQELSNIGWFDVLFEDCSITVSGPTLSLVNASFRNCAVSCSEQVAHVFPAVASGNASGITFYLNR
jgi:hypothetical protein